MSPVVLINHLLEPPGKITGISNYLFSLLPELIRRGEFRFVLATCWKRDDLPASLRYADLEVRTLGYVASMPANILRQLVLIPRLMRETRATLEFNPDPVGCFWPARRVIVVHDLYFDVAPQAYRRRHVLWWRLFFPRAIRAAHRIVCVSESTRRDLLRFHPEAASKAVVVHEAGCLAPAHAPQERARSGLLVANISPNKNVGVLVEALAKIAAQGRDVTVHHVGRDEPGEIAKAQARLRTAARPVGLGSVDRDRLSELYGRAAFFVCPSTYEGFCLPVLEAQSHGAPVIASDIPVLREVAGEAAFFHPQDAAALAGLMLRVLDDAHFAHSLSERGRVNAKRFSWDRAAAETSAVFRAVLEPT